MLQDGDDYHLIDMGEESLFMKEDEREDFLNGVFKRRLSLDPRIPESGRDLNGFLGRLNMSKTEFARRLRMKKADLPPKLAHQVTGDSQRRGATKPNVLYHGANVFASLWSGDTRIMIQLIQELSGEVDGQTKEVQVPILPEKQNRVFSDRGGTWLEAQARNHPTNPDRIAKEVRKLQKSIKGYQFTGNSYAATVKISGQTQTLAMTWGDDTWGQIGTGNDTNADDFCAGTYTYVLTGPNTAVMTNTDIGMMSALDTTNVSIINVTFTSATSANCTWTNDNVPGSATLTLSHVKNLMPASIAGRTAKISVKGTPVTTVGFDSGGNFESSVVISSTTYTSTGTYTFTQYSPTVAVLKRVWTAPANVVGDVQYAEAIFTSTTDGDIFGSYYNSLNLNLGSNPNVIGLGTFTTK